MLRVRLDSGMIKYINDQSCILKCMQWLIATSILQH